MPASPSTSAQAARRRLGEQLREMRQAAGLSGVVFAREAGWRDSSLVSRIERGQRTITADHVRLWCRICGASEQRTEELLAEQSAAVRMWRTNAQLKRAGLRQLQTEDRDRYQQARSMRFYATKGIPGLLQTEAYATWALRSIRHEFGMEHDDVAEAVAARMERNRVLRGPGRFAIILEQEALWHRTCPTTTHREQLLYLLDAMRLPSVSLGIIPWARERNVNGFGVWPDETFLISNDEQVTVELVSGYLTITTPEEIRAYIRAWERMAALAVHGDQAVAIIRAALAALDEYES
ncbi:helix-turn-helix domain-containing protein [Actinomadura keratinilytica]